LKGSLNHGWFSFENDEMQLPGIGFSIGVAELEKAKVGQILRDEGDHFILLKAWMPLGRGERISLFYL